MSQFGRRGRSAGVPRSGRAVLLAAVSTAPRSGLLKHVWLLAGLLAALLPIPAVSGVENSRQSPAPSATGSPGAAIPAGRQASNLAIITIKGEINAVTSVSVKRRIQAAIDAGADGLVFDIDSPGGEVGAVLEITSAIKSCPITNTIAWVNPAAYSGGAITALACRRIVVAPHATMGDAAPIAVNPVSGLMPLPDTERQKLLAPLLAEVVDSARTNGYDEKLVQGFIMLGVELWLIRDKQTGARFFVDEAEYRAVFGSEPPRTRASVASGQAPSGARGTVPAPATQDPKAFRPASSTLSEATAREVDESLDVPSPRPDFGPADAQRYELVEYATDGQTLLTLKERELKRFGLADPNATISTDADLQAYVGASHVRRLDQSWSETLVAFMTQGISGWITRALLIVVFLMAMFIEMSIPGATVPGLIALLALAGLVVPPMLIGASTWWALAAIVGGVLSLLLEIFVLPGFGVAGVLGLLLLFAGLVGTFADAGQLFPGAGRGGGADLAWAASVVLLSIFVAGTGVYLFVKHTHRFPIAGRLVLSERQRATDADEPTLLGAMIRPAAAEAGGLAIGAIGRSITPLRPSGSAEFGERIVDVVSEFGFVDAGRPVRVTSVTEYRVGVEPHSDAPGAKDRGGNA